MARKDSEKETDRPHYYSQFWLDVAAGRHIIGGQKSEESEGIEPEPEPVEPVTARKATRTAGHTEHANGAERRHEAASAKARPVVEPEVVEEEEPEPEPDDPGALDIDNEVEDLDLQGEDIEDADIPDMDLSGRDFDEDEEDFFEEEEEEEEDWGRARKKAKPSRSTKPPTKRPKRDRRTF